MNVTELRDYCLSLPMVTEDFPFNESILAFKILGKIFAESSGLCKELMA